MTDAPDYRAWCELKGEAYVREALASERIVGAKATFARQWLDERDRRAASSQAEALEIARSAKDAAWAAARAAREANAAARTARLIAIAAAIAAVAFPIIAALFE